jgi:integrase
MASYRKLPSGNWYAEIMLLGVRDSKGGFPTKGHAKAWAEPREDEIRASKGKSTVQKTLIDALDRYVNEVTAGKKGKVWEEIRIKKFKRELDFVGKLMNDVDASDIAAWRDAGLKRKTKPLKPGTVNREMNVLSNVFTVAMTEWKWCKSNPVREVKRPKNPHGRDRLTEPEERQAMLDALGYVEGMVPKLIKHRVAYAYLIALETAMRAGEICSVTAQMQHLDEKYIALPDTKNGKRRNVSLSSRAVDLWRFFPNGIGLTPGQIDSNWRLARERAGVVDLTFHDSCHQAITDLARKLNVPELSRTTGRSIKTLMIYYNESPTTISDKLG